MTAQRLSLVAGLCMVLTGAVVYMLTPARTPPVSSGLEAPEDSGDAEVPPALASTQAASASAPTIPGRSQPPSKEEWDTAPDTRVEGAEKLGCSAKKLREWLRVACATGSNPDSEPTDVQVLNARLIKTDPPTKGLVRSAWRAPQGALYTAASSGFTSIVCPFVEGIDMRARFDWSDKKATLVVTWPTGRPEPQMKGTFVFPPP